jgi:methionine-rich copper-binding protein CopC
MGHHGLVPTSSRSSQLRALLLGMLLVVGLPVAAAGTASAHVRFVSISPAVNATLTKAPKAVVVTFDNTLTPGLSVVTVKSPIGANVSQGKATEAGPVVTQALLPDLPGGMYTIAWKVVSDDGHPVSGRSSFTVQTAGASPLATTTTSTAPSTSASVTPPVATAIASPSTPGSTTGSSGGLGSGAKGLLYILALAALVYGILGVARARRKQRAANPGGKG